MHFARVFRVFRVLRALRTATFVGALGVLVSCETLPDLARDVCGNGVKEPGEDCDEVAASKSCGAPQSPGACRYVCGIDTAGGGGTSACPTGFGCGTDFICRKRATDGAYVASPSVAVGADRMFAANLAGTGQYSLLAVSRDANDVGYPRLLAFDATGQRTADETLQGAFGLADVGDVNADGKDDVLFSRIDGLLLSLGEDATTLRAVASDGIALPPGARATLITVPGSAALDTAGGRTSELMALVSNLGSPFDPTHTYLVGPDLALGATADFDWPVQRGLEIGSRVSTLADPAYQCERIVLVNRGGTEIDSVQPCCLLAAEQRTSACRDGQRLLRGAAGQRDRLANASAPIAYGPWSLDVDGDGRIDVVVATRASEAAALRLEVAYANDVVPSADDVPGGTTRALFGAPPAQGEHATLARSTSVLPLYDDADPRPQKLTTLLDVGAELRDVQVLDEQNRTVTESRRYLTFVDEDFIAHARYSTSAADSRYQVGLRRASSWTSARLASFNDDGLLDVVGGRSRAVDLDVGLGTSDLGLNMTSVRTGLSTDQIEIADVDGDRVNDVLITSNARGSSTLSVLFGRAGSFPNEVSSLGTFDRVRQIVAAPLAFNLQGEDAAADVGVVTNTVTGEGASLVESDSVTILRSVGGRLPYSLYGLGPAKVIVNDVATQINAGPLASTVVLRGAVTDVVAVGNDFHGPAEPDTFRFWSGAVNTDPRVRLSTSVVGATLAIDATLGGAGGNIDVGFNTLVRAIDVDGDGNEEVVGISSALERSAPVVFLGAYADPGYGLALAPTPISIAADGGPFYRVFGLEVVDVDGDGRLDVVAMLASAPSFQANDDTDLFDLGVRNVVLVVIPNQNGQLAPSAATVLTPPDDLRAIAVGAISGPGVRELVVTTTGASKSGVYVFRSGRFDALYTEPPEMRIELRVLPGVRSLVVADVSGDGVDDLVVGARDRVSVLTAQAENP